MITTATRAEFLGHALEQEIRERVNNRHWHRHHRAIPHSDPCRMADLERENDRALRLLFGIRRDGLRMHREERARVVVAFRKIQADLAGAHWSEADGPTSTSWTESENRWAWGDR